MNLSAPVLSSTWEPKPLFRCFYFCRLACRDSVFFPCYCSNVLSHSSLNDPRVPVQRVFFLYLPSHHEQPQLHFLLFHHVLVLWPWARQLSVWASASSSVRQGYTQHLTPQPGVRTGGDSKFTTPRAVPGPCWVLARTLLSCCPKPPFNQLPWLELFTLFPFY